MTSNFQSVQLSVSGRVQGVGFRWTTIQLARENNLTGWVKNELDGTVSIVAQGPSEQLKAFIEQIKNSPSPYAIIKAVTINYITISKLSGFNVKY